MRAVSLIVAAVLAAGPLAAPAFAGDIAAPAVAAKPAAKFSTTTTPIGTLLDNPATKAILDKILPGLSSNGQIDMARGMTLKAIQPYAADKLTDDRLAAVDAELAKVQ